MKALSNISFFISNTLRFQILIGCYHFADFNYIQMTGHARDEYTGNRITARMEVIDTSGQTRVCWGKKSLYPILELSSVTATYTNGRILSCEGSFPNWNR